MAKKDVQSSSEMVSFSNNSTLVLPIEDREEFKSLHWLVVREWQLKTAIVYEKLKKTSMSCVSGCGCGCGDISDLEIDKQNLKKKQLEDKLYNDQLHLEKLIRSSKTVSAKCRIFSKSQNVFLKPVIKQNHSLKKKLAKEQKIIAGLKETIEKYNQGFIVANRTKKRKMGNIGSNIKSQKLEWVQSNNKTVFERMQLLTKITQTLIDQHLSMTSPSHISNLLLPLQEVCKSVLHVDLCDDLQNMQDLFTQMCDLKI